VRTSRRILNLLGLLGTAAVISLAPPGAAAEPIASAEWIWSAQPGFLCHARRTFELEREPRSASLQITCDNGYELYVNGSFLGSDIGAESAVWQSVESYDIGAFLKAGRNVVAVRATDLGGQAGLIVGMQIELADGQAVQLSTDASWRTAASNDPTGFAELSFVEDASWSHPAVIGKNGCAPWGVVSGNGPRSPNLAGATGQGRGFKEPPADFDFPGQILAVRGRAPESSTAGALQAAWRIGNSRACLELDTLGPSMPGHRLVLLQRDEAGGAYLEKTLWQRPGALAGSPSITHDGRIVLFSCVLPGEKFWRIGRIALDTGEFQAITDGRFHDFDPEPMPDGRILFSSTRIGNREEYHGNMARSIFAMNADGSGIRSITHHIVADTEPKLTAAGNIVFVRQDNFMERAKVETHIHSVRPDGTAGQVLLGPDRGALAYSSPHAAEENGLWLRNFGFGSPAPLPDGRVAALSSMGLIVSGDAVRPQLTLRPALELVDLSPLSDGRLLCTLAGHSGVGVIDLESNEIVRIYSKPPFDLHSPVSVRSRPAPLATRSSVAEEAADHPGATGYLLGQSVFLTRQSNVDMSRVKGIRVIEGRPFGLRSARHPYAHLGVEAVELGTAPVAPDGSFYVEVPADRALSLQAVDGQGRSVVNELSWIYVRPGEQRSCVGCHSQREAAPPPGGGLMALRSRPLKLAGQGTPHRWRGNNAANGGVLNLQFDRMREIASINSASAPLSTLLQELQCPDEDARISAAQRLALLREKKAAPALEQALSDASAQVRVNAAWALASCGRKESLPLLFRAMFEDEPLVAQAAGTAMQTLAAATLSFDPFAAPGEKMAARAAWQELAGREGVPQLGSILARRAAEKPSEDVFNALGQIGGAPEAESIRSFLRGDNGGDLRVTLAAIRALGQIGDTNSIWTLDALLRRHMLLPTNRPAGDHEFGWTQAPVQMAAAAAEALGRIGTACSERELTGAFSRLADFWHYSFNTADHDWLMGCNASPIHFRILEALDRMEARGAGTIAAKIVQSVPIDPDRGLLFENDAYETLAARVIERSGTRPAIVEACADVLLGRTSASPFLAAVTNSPPAVSVEPMCPSGRAAQILSALAVPADAPLLRAAFEQHLKEPASRSRSWTCFYLARGLGRVGGNESASALAACLSEEKPESLHGLLTPPNVFVYEAMTPFYRAAAADALGRIGGASGAVLLAAATDLRNALDVRNAAAQALVRLAPAELAAELKAAAAAHPENSTRRLLGEAHRKAADVKKLARKE
jgi:HEAT repeat protein